MTVRLNLGQCNDPNIAKLSSLLKRQLIKAGEEVKVSDGKIYQMTPSVAYTKANKPVGEVCKRYSLNSSDGWVLQTRNVRNNRGSYERSIVNGEETVSLGGQQEFIKVDDDSYIQKSYMKHPVRFATADEIEAAIDYVKGKGSVENYQKLLRNNSL